jgi:magnesium-transporting ATPase (P-type)
MVSVSQEVASRLETYGPNELARGKKHSAIMQFLMNFKNPLVIVLMVAGLISGVVAGDYPSMIIIYIIFFLSICVSWSFVILVFFCLVLFVVGVLDLPLSPQILV